ncbi:MAG: hypothetical protein V4467_03585 [Patescibacteria group bacterium]
MFSFLIFSIAIILGFVGVVSLKRGAIFLPMERRKLTEMLNVVKIIPGQKTLDLGSGDGRIVIAMAEAGALAHGFEHNPILVWWSRWKVKRKGLVGKAFIHNSNFWEEDFSSYSVITVFGINYIMEKLEDKLTKETRIGTQVISYLFPLPTWKPTAIKKGFYFYTRT